MGSGWTSAATRPSCRLTRPASSSAPTAAAAVPASAAARRSIRASIRWRRTSSCAPHRARCRPPRIGSNEGRFKTPTAYCQLPTANCLLPYRLLLTAYCFSERAGDASNGAVVEPDDPTNDVVAVRQRAERDRALREHARRIRPRERERYRDDRRSIRLARHFQHYGDTHVGCPIVDVERRDGDRFRSELQLQPRALGTRHAEHQRSERERTYRREPGDNRILRHARSSDVVDRRNA